MTNVEFVETCASFFVAFTLVPRVAVTDISTALPMISHMPLLCNCKNKLPSVCVQISPFCPARPSHSSPEAELFFSPTHAWYVGSLSSVSELPPSTPAGRNSFIAPPLSFFPPPPPCPGICSLLPTRQELLVYLSVTNISALLLCSTHLHLPKLTVHSPSVLFRKSDACRHFTRPSTGVTAIVLLQQVPCPFLFINSPIRVWLTFTLNLEAVSSVEALVSACLS